MGITKEREDIFTKLLIQSVTWESVAESMFRRYEPGTGKQRETIARFGKLWRSLSYELCDSTHINEYNAMKHGFRVQKGGFSIAMGKEPFHGTFPHDSEMVELGKSDYGNTFFTLEPLTQSKKERSFRVACTSTNWSIERLLLLSQLVHISITNVVAGLRILNGFKPSECKFASLSNPDDFDKPWKFTPGVMNMVRRNGIDENAVSLTREELFERVAEFKRKRLRSPVDTPIPQSNEG